MIIDIVIAFFVIEAILFVFDLIIRSAERAEA